MVIHPGPCNNSVTKNIAQLMGQINFPHLLNSIKNPNVTSASGFGGIKNPNVT